MFYPTTCVGFRYRGRYEICLADFLGAGLPPLSPCPGARCTVPVQHPLPDLPGRNIPTRFNALFRQCAGVSLLRLHIALIPSNGMLTVSSIGCALRLCLRSRLTLIRLALIGNPWSYGGEFLAPPCRYFIPTFAFPGPPERLAPFLRRLPECSLPIMLKA